MVFLVFVIINHKSYRLIERSVKNKDKFEIQIGREHPITMLKSHSDCYKLFNINNSIPSNYNSDENIFFDSAILSVSSQHQSLLKKRTRDFEAE